MTDPNVIEIKELRKRRFFLELIKNTSSCCLNWVRLSVNQNQFKSSKDNFEFILSSTGTGITLDVIKDFRFASSYNSSENAEIQNLYDTVVLIQDKQFYIVADEEKRLIETLQLCRCTNTWDEYPEGGVVIGGSAEVYMPQRIFETMMGGVVVSGNSDWRQAERFFEIMDGGVVVGGNSSALVIGPDTYIYIWFDSSGSMSATEVPLNTMKNVLLKDALLPLYNNDSDLYDSHVFVQNRGTERTLDIIHRSENTVPFSHPETGPTPVGYLFPEDASNVIVMFFQDEASPVYHQITSVLGSRTNTYESDITALRWRLENGLANDGFYRAVIFQVNGFPIFGELLKAIQWGNSALINGANDNYPLYEPPWGLKDYSTGDNPIFNFKYGIINGSTASYYLEEVLSALEELGFEVR